MGSDDLFERLKYQRVVGKNGGVRYYNSDGQLHRENGPAITFPSGTQEWRINGKRHRTDGPAVIYPDGSQYWFIDGKLFAEEGFNARESNG